VAQPPNAPSRFAISSYTNTRVSGRASANWNGGATILEWQVAWGTNPTHTTASGHLNPDGTGVITGLTPGVTYYIVSRQRNAYGWSPFSEPAVVRMRDRPDPPSKPIALNKTQTTVNLMTAPGWTGDSPITSYTFWISNSPNSVDSGFVRTSPRIFIFGMKAAYNYYLWAQATNIYGTSDLSARGQVLLVAGARVNVGGVWKRAIPYVNDNGVWKMARSWEKVNGVWKQLPD
jgi:hypothetical protein